MATILITGVARGVGRALAKAYVQRGDRVFGTVRAGSSPVSLPGLNLLTLDVRVSTAIAAAADAMREPLDVLINNAGIIGPAKQSTLEMDYPGFSDTLDVNVMGPLRVVQAFLPHLRRSKAPKILTLSSQMGATTSNRSDRIAYRASKAALNKLMQCVAIDLKADGITVAVAHPGWVRTDMGGTGADISAEQSAEGLVRLVDQLDIGKTGRFFDWTGQERAW